MDEKSRNAALGAQLKKKRKGRTLIQSKYRLKYPDRAEREYFRLSNEYMAAEKEVLLKYLPRLKFILEKGSTLRMDSARDKAKQRRAARFAGFGASVQELEALFESKEKELDATLGVFDIQRRLRHIASVGEGLSLNEWKKAVKKTFGLNLLDDYYKGSRYEELIRGWVSENVDLIKTLKKESLGKLKEQVYRNYMGGKSTTEIVKALESQYQMDKRHAKLIARDQTAKLNAAITKSQQTDAGVTHYKWSTSRDGRVRDSHAELDGKIFSWDEPPETDGGRYCHPGEDYQCRCCAIPVFDLDKITLPVGGGKEEGL